MKLYPMKNSDIRYQYWRCSNPGDGEYTLVRFNGGIEHEYLCKLFAEVELSEHFLPAWRLYEAR